MTPEEFWTILHDVPETKPVFYRLYHDDQGRPLFYSMEAVPGTYIEIDQAAYSLSDMAVRVVDGKLQPYRIKELSKLVISDTGTPCSEQDVAVVDPESTTYWRKHTYVDQSN